MSIAYGITVFFHKKEDFQILSQLGAVYPFVQYVEFRAETPFLVPGQTPVADVRYYRDILRAAGLKNTMHATYFEINLATQNPWLKDANIACYRDYIDLASFLESEVLVVHGGTLLPEFLTSPNKEILWETARRNLCESLYELAEYGQKKGVKIAVENLPPEGLENVIFDLESHLAILDRVDHPNLGGIYDLAHAFLYQQDVLAYLAGIRPRLFEIHAHNNNGQFDDHFGLPHGKMDYAEILAHPDCRGIPFIMEINSRSAVLETLEWLKGRGE